MARLARRTLLILLPFFGEGALLVAQSPLNASKANSSVPEKVEVIDAKNSVAHSLVRATYRKYQGHSNATDATNASVDVQAESEKAQFSMTKVAVLSGKKADDKYYLEKGCKILKNPRAGLDPSKDDKPPYTKTDPKKMTYDKCYYSCVEHKSLFFAVKNGDQCSCFDRYDFLLPPEAGENCDKPCTGDGQINCGGAEASNVFVLESWVPELPTKDCGKPDEVPHIAEMCDNGGEEHGLTCDVKCVKGYRLAENSLMCDTAAGMWFGFVHCTPYLCMRPAPPIAFASKVCGGGAVEGVKHAQFGVDCPVTCLPGYDLKENTLKCVQPDNPKEPKALLQGAARCEPKSCGPPTRVAHAQFPTAAQTFPTRVMYTCQNGYTLDGTLTGLTYRHVACEMDGKYEKSSFECLPLVCGNAPMIADAELTISEEDDIKFPAAATYKCHKGFSADGTGTGERILTVPCQATGAFPDPLPECKPVKCGGPPQVAFAKLLESDAAKGVGVAGIEIVPLGFEQTAVLKCKSGYSFKPDVDPTVQNMQFVVQCEDSGLFENVQVCAPVSCGVPPPAENTLRAEMPVVFGNFVEYSCLDGYSLTGTTQGARSFKLNCMENRRFSDLPASKGCLPLECGRPKKIEHGKLVRGAAGEIVKFPSAIQYKCDEGFSTDRTKASGSRFFSVGCESTGAFSDYFECLPIDDCVGHTCGPQGECEDLHMDYKCVCQSGFEPVVNEMTQEKECGNINDCGPEACGAGRCEDLVEGYKCHCPRGYEVKSPSEAPANETCARVECGAPPIAQKADRPSVKGSYEDRVDYTCLVGYTLDGTPGGQNMFHTICEADKSFTPVPDCKPVSCGRPPKRKNSELDKPGEITFEQKIRYTCLDGFSTDGSLIPDTKSYGAECLETGAFTDFLECKPIICGSPKGMAFSSVSATILVFKQQATYTCLEGYSIDGSTAIAKMSFPAECQADGSFKRGAPGCEPVNCGSAPNVDNAIAELAKGDVVFPSLLSYSCLEGYSLDGKITGERIFNMKCEKDGKFSGKQLCKNVECGAPPAPEHAIIVKGGDIDVGVFGNLIKYKCKKGYALEPLPTDLELIPPGGERKFEVSCQANGQYSAVATCKNIDDCVGHTCGPHGTCVDGLASFSCQCEPGFEQTMRRGEPFCGNVDDCGSHKCGEHGTCVDQIQGYTCACSMGYHIKTEGADTICEANSCGDMPTVENADHDSSESKLVFPMTVTYECKEGYSIDKTLTPAAKVFQVNCDANGDTQNLQSCLPITCPMPGGIVNLKSAPPLSDLANFKDKLSYECMDGYTTTGEAGGASKFDLECGHEGLFLPEVFPVCAPVKCGKPPAFSKANYPDSDMFFPAIVPYACDLGYSLDGTTGEEKLGFSIRCTKGGTFTQLPMSDPKCKKVKCGNFPEVGNAKYDEGKTGHFEDALEYKCKDGYTVDGSAQGQTSWTVSCQANGEFTGSYECVPITFTVLGRMKNAVNNRAIPGGKAVLTYKDQDGQVSSDGNGIGEFNLQAVRMGKAIIKYTAQGFIDGEVKLDVQSNIQSGTAADIAMSPKMSKDSWRAVLAWGKKPYDLDTHLQWKNRRSCHVYYARRRVDCPDGVTGVLDVDDTRSFGPETLTFKNVGKDYNPKVRAAGPDRAPILEYKIRNYSRRPLLETLSDSTIKLYNGERLVKEFKIGRDGRLTKYWWYVFELNAYTGELVQ
jgi:CUB/sushi domain-containing protein